MDVPKAPRYYHESDAGRSTVRPLPPEPLFLALGTDLERWELVPGTAFEWPELLLQWFHGWLGGIGEAKSVLYLLRKGLGGMIREIRREGYRVPGLGLAFGRMGGR